MEVMNESNVSFPIRLKCTPCGSLLLLVVDDFYLVGGQIRMTCSVCETMLDPTPCLCEKLRRLIRQYAPADVASQAATQPLPVIMPPPITVSTAMAPERTDQIDGVPSEPYMVAIMRAYTIIFFVFLAVAVGHVIFGP